MYAHTHTHTHYVNVVQYMLNEIQTNKWKPFGTDGDQKMPGLVLI